MYEDSNTKWFSQTLLTFKDKYYGTDGYLRVSVSTNTEDYKFFNPPVFNISITNNYQKSFNINIADAEDLLESFQQALKQMEGNETIVEKKYQKNMKIYFKFTVASSNDERVVIIEIISSESDATKVVIPLKPTFQSFLRRLRKFTENYDQLCMNLLSNSINSETVQTIQQIPSLIKGISGQIISNVPSESSIPDSPARVTDTGHTASTIEDLDKFLGDDMSNISIPEIDKDKATEKPTLLEIKSKFVEKVLNNDLTNLENKLTSFAVSTIPVLELGEDLGTELGLDMFPGISEDDKKSLLYISTKLYKETAQEYTINNVSIPGGTPALKFKPSGNTEDHTDLALDLFLFMGYLRNVRRRLENKIENAFDNKAILYLHIRCFMDPFCFSYIEKMSKEDIVSMTMNRYKFYKSQGVFDKYDSLIDQNRCPEIKETDILQFAEEASEKIVGNTPLIDKLHEYLYSKGDTKLPAKNSFKLEQIINEFIPIEVAVKTGFDITDKEISSSFQESNNISDEIWKYYTGSKRIKSKEEPKKKVIITPLQRWVDKYKQDIPETYRDNFVKEIKELVYEKYDFSQTKYPLEEFDDKIVKALYVWDISADKDMRTNFTHFAALVENEQMTKENILIVSKNETQEEGCPWDDMSFDTE